MNDQVTVQAPAAKPAMPTVRTSKSLAQCKTLREAFETDSIKKMIAESMPRGSLAPEAMFQAWLAAASKQPLIYQADLRQALGCFKSLAMLGLRPNSLDNTCDIIPFKAKARNPATGKWDLEIIELQVFIRYGGYIELAARAGDIRTIKPTVIYKGDKFAYREGQDFTWWHEPNIERDSYAATPIAVGATVYYKDGGVLPEVMSWPDIMRIKARSQAFIRALAAKDEAEKTGKRAPRAWTDAPWVRDEIEMAKKTPVRRVSKIIPRCPDLRAAIGIEERQDDGRLDFGPVIDGTLDPMTADMPIITDQSVYDQDGQAGGAGATFTDRREPETVVKDEKQQTPTSQAKPQQTPPVEESKPAVVQTVKQPPEPVAQLFESILLDQFGDDVGETYTDPVRWAEALVGLFDACTTSGQVGTLLEFNEASIEAAQAFAAAATILQALEQSPSSFAPPPNSKAADPEPDLPGFLVVGPPLGRNSKPDWSGYVRLFKEMMATIASAHPERLSEWAEVQREQMGAIPVAQRMLVVRALGPAIGATGVTPPEWLSNMGVAPKRATPEPDPKPTPSVESKPDNDLRWAERSIQFVATLNTAEDVLREMGAGAVKDKMLRLKADRPDLFIRVDEAIAARLRQLGQQDGPPEPEPGDPGHGGEDMPDYAYRQALFERLGRPRGGLVLSHILVFEVVEEASDPPTIDTIARGVGLHSSRTSRLVQALADAGIVKRTEAPFDRRKTIVTLTKRGHDVASAARASLSTTAA